MSLPRLGARMRAVTRLGLMLFAALLLWPLQAFAALDVEYSVFGAYSLSADAGGNANGPTYQVQVQKPANATVHRVFAIVAAIPGRGTPPANALTFTVGATDITPNLTQTRTSANTNPIGTRFDDVTASMAAALNGLPTGLSNLTVRENIASNGDWDGSALLVIWNDPSVTNGNVAIKLGAERTDLNPTLILNVAPVDTSVMGLSAQLGAGVSFSTGDGSQVSNLFFEGTRLTALLGGFEDGARADGALITLGGIGDTPSRADNDERYDVTDLLTQGDTQLEVRVTSGINNDYLFAFWFEGRGIRSQVDILSPLDNTLTSTEPAYSGTATPGGSTVSLTWRDATTNAVVSTASVTATAAGAWSAPAQNLPDGRYTLTASITNMAGTFTDVVTFTLDTTAPTVTLINPANGSAGNDNTPTINGSAEVGATVSVVIRNAANVVVQTLLPTVSAAGNWTIDAMTLVDGAYTATATATDAAGNTATAGPNAFTVDTTPPAIAITAPLTGTSTNDNTPAITGTTTAGATVSVVIRNAANAVVQTLNPTVNAAGNWTINSPTLTDGAYTVTATATDAAGNTASAGPNAFIIDTVPPAVTLSAPVNNSSTNDTTPTISGTVSAGATLVVTLVNANGVVVQTLNPMGTSWSVDAAALAQGTYTVRAVATDAAGNSATATRTFTIDTTAPTVAIAAPANNSSTNDTTPTISGTSEPSSVVTVTITNSNGMTSFSGDVTTNAAGAWTINSSALPEGTYVVGASARDAAGNVGLAMPVTFSVDVTAPTVAIIAPADGSASNNNTPVINGSAEVGATVVVTIRDSNNAVIQTLNPVVDVTGAWSVNAASLADGAYTVRAVATDVAGNTAAAGPNAFTVDTAPPVVVFVTPADGSSTNDNTPPIEGTTEVGASVDVIIRDSNGVVVQTLATSGLGVDWGATALTLPDGVYTATATARDAVGNSATATSTFSIDTVAPVVSITGPADGAFIASVRPDLTGTSEPGSSVEVTLTDAAGTIVHTATVVADAVTGTWSVSLPADLVDGAYNVGATATDAAGNTGSGMSTFTVDTAVLPLDITAPVAGSATSDNTPDITGATSPMTTVTVTITDANGVVITTQDVTSDNMGAWSLTPMTLADGTYDITATVTTLSGLTTTATTNVTVDTVAPMVTLDSPAAGDSVSTNDDTPTITGTATAGSTVTVIITDANGMVVQTLMPVLDMMGGWSIDATTLPEGTYTVDVNAEDAAGNVGSDGPATLTVDITAPSLTLDAPTAGQIVGTRDVPVLGTSDPNQEVTVEILDANGTIVSTQLATTDVNGAWTVTATGLGNGEYTARATATDAAANTTTQQVSFTVDSDEPFVSVETPADGITLSNSSPMLTGRADADAVVEVIIRDAQGMEIARQLATVNMDGTWSAALAQPLADGQYTIEANSTRPNGKTAQDTNTFTIDTMAPVTTVDTPAAGSTSNNTMPTIAGTSEPGATVTVTVKDANGATVFTGDVIVDANGQWSIPAGTLADGAYTVETSTVDAGGNTSTTPAQDFTIDSSAPTLTITSPAPNETITETQPTISGTADAGATVEVFIDGQSIGQATAGADGVWSIQAPEALATGAHTTSATTTNDAGSTVSTGDVNFTIKTSTPIVITAPTTGGTVTGPSVTVTGTGEPGTTVTVTIGAESQTVTVGADGSWTVTFDEVPAGSTTITAEGDGQMTSVTVNVVQAPAGGYVVTGGAFDCASTGTQQAPTSGLLLFIGLLGMRAMRRRRRRA